MDIEFLLEVLTHSDHGGAINRMRSTGVLGRVFYLEQDIDKLEMKMKKWK